MELRNMNYETTETTMMRDNKWQGWRPEVAGASQSETFGLTVRELQTHSPKRSDSQSARSKLAGNAFSAARTLMLLMLFLAFGATVAWGATEVTKTYQATSGGTKTGADEVELPVVKIAFGSGEWTRTSNSITAEGVNFSGYVQAGHE